MRIRKNACKLLGSTSVYANPWPPPPPPPPAAAACGVTGIVCELNCSPWDVMLIDNLPNFACSSSSSSSCSLTNPKAEDEVGGILGNLLKTEVEEPISAAIASTAADLTIKASIQMDEKKIKKLERKKSKGKEKAAAEMMITLCKKNDGKGWHCKRPAQLPHSFCGYHLAQTRSYSSSHRATSDHASEATAAETRAEGGDSNNLYYYYDGFGPWRGKRRGRPVVSAANKVKEGGGDDGRKSMERDDDVDNVVAGDDEYDLDCYDEDEDDDDDDDCYSMPHQDNYKEDGKKRDGEELEKKRVVVKKRGRKPLKSRSLKSLL